MNLIGDTFIIIAGFSGRDVESVWAFHPTRLKVQKDGTNPELWWYRVDRDPKDDVQPPTRFRHASISLNSSAIFVGGGRTSLSNECLNDGWIFNL